MKMATGMDMARFLKLSANLLMAAVLVKYLARDMSAELRRDAQILRSRSNARLRASPYGTVAAAAAIGVVGGILLTRRRRVQRHVS
jgi:ElaB/YqjD/DUF883 family membrane-anchored ribosome-binding protein